MPLVIATNSATALGWLPYVVLGLWLSLCAYSQTPASSVCSLWDDTLIGTTGDSPVYLLRGGRKYHIQNVNWIKRNGYGGKPVQILKPSEVAAIPSGYDLAEQAPIPGTPAAMDEKLVIGPDGKIYVVTEGERHWILSARWIAESRYAHQVPHTGI